MTTTFSPKALRRSTVPVADPARSYDALRAEIDAAVAQVLRSGRFILGEQVAAFEAEYAAYLGCRHAIGVGSGTDALRVALMACEIGPGDEVITVANAGDPTPLAIWSVGARPRLVDIDPRRETMSIRDAERVIGARTKAILPVHLYGQPADLDGLANLAKSAGLRLIEDACQAHGAKYSGRLVGTIGDIGCFSFYPTKNLGAFGDGGMVVTNDDDLARRARLLREYGWQSRNRSVLKGIASRLDELQAALLRVKLPHLDEWNVRRRHLAALYQSRLAKLPDLELPAETSDCYHVFHLFVVRTSRREELRRHLAVQGVGTGVHYPTPTHWQPSFDGFWATKPSLPITEAHAGDVLSLPLFPELTDNEFTSVVDGVSGFFDNRSP
jgi:dTDP-4-amino-4,6-dideoxygalactose transaminase